MDVVSISGLMVCCCVSTSSSCVTVVSNFISYYISSGTIFVYSTVTPSGSSSISSASITTYGSFSIYSSGWLSFDFPLFCQTHGGVYGS